MSAVCDKNERDQSSLVCRLSAVGCVVMVPNAYILVILTEDMAHVILYGLDCQNVVLESIFHPQTIDESIIRIIYQYGVLNFRSRYKNIQEIISNYVKCQDIIFNAEKESTRNLYRNQIKSLYGEYWLDAYNIDPTFYQITRQYQYRP